MTDDEYLQATLQLSILTDLVRRIPLEDLLTRILGWLWGRRRLYCFLGWLISLWPQRRDPRAQDLADAGAVLIFVAVAGVLFLIARLVLPVALLP